jgi:hypothetical protein
MLMLILASVINGSSLLFMLESTNKMPRQHTSTHRSLISRTENLIDCLKCRLSKELSVLLEYVLVQKDYFEVKELIGV